MEGVNRRKLKFFLRLNYPMQVVVDADSAKGRYPDLPGCELVRKDLEDLKIGLELLRQDWLTKSVEAGETPPMPNSHLLAEGDGVPPIG